MIVMFSKKMRKKWSCYQRKVWVLEKKISSLTGCWCYRYCSPGSQGYRSIWLWNCWFCLNFAKSSFENIPLHRFYFIVFRQNKLVLLLLKALKEHSKEAAKRWAHGFFPSELITPLIWEHCEGLRISELPNSGGRKKWRCSGNRRSKDPRRKTSCRTKGLLLQLFYC